MSFLPAPSAAVSRFRASKILRLGLTHVRYYRAAPKASLENYTLQRRPLWLAALAKRAMARAGHYGRHLSADRFPGVAVLCYHGVRDRSTAASDIPFGPLHVSEDELREHCSVLAKHAHPIGLGLWLDALERRKHLPDRAVLVTFDDGYRSVSTLGKPILETFDVPAVVFISTEAVRARTTGGFLEALGARGIDGYGVDISEWAVARASETLGPGRAFRCDAELDPLPAELVAKGPFRTFILWAVFEHFRDPFRVLAKLSEVAASGSVLLLNTTNADSLCHRVFGQEWEGYFDGSHHGIDRVSADSVRRELAALGWRIERMETDVTWDRSADPLHATLREWWHADARFRQLLVEKELGDFLTCVAIKT